MKRIDSGMNDKIPVVVTDLSKTGIGFKCDQLLAINSVYEAELTIWTKEVIHSFINVIRLDNSGDDYLYGATFVGMTETDISKIMIYEMFDELNEGKEM